MPGWFSQNSYVALLISWRINYLFSESIGLFSHSPVDALLVHGESLGKRDQYKIIALHGACDLQ